MLDLWFSGPLGPLLIFSLRIIDVSMATVRTLLIMRGAARVVPAIAFVESMLWVIAVGSAIQHLDSVWHVLGYAGGFASGNVVGLWLESKLALGFAAVRAVAPAAAEGTEPLASALWSEGIGATEFAGVGRDGPVRMVVSVVPRRDVRHLLDLIRARAPEAFVSIEEPRSIQRGWMLQRRRK